MSISPGSDNIRVTILDDHKLVRDGLSEMLTREGIEVVAVYGEPQPFLDGLSNDRPNVAIVDLLLQDASGLEVVRKVHDRHPEIHVLVLTGSTDPEVVQRCMEVGAAGFLDKLSAGSKAVAEAVRGIEAGRGVFPVDSLGTLLAQARERSEPPAEPELLRVLSVRERQVLSFVAEGADNLKIAALLGITERTVKAHVSSLYRKLGAENRTQMALLAHDLGLRPTARH